MPRDPWETTEQPQRELLIIRLQSLQGNASQLLHSHTGAAGEPVQEQTQMSGGVPGERLIRTSLCKVQTSAEHSTRPDPHLSKVADSAVGAEIFPAIYTFTLSAVPAVVSSVRLDAAAFGTLVHHLSWLELQALDEFFGRVPFRHGSLRERMEKKKKDVAIKSSAVVSLTADFLQRFRVVHLAARVP